MSEKVLKRLQRKCWRALVIYTDLAEACCSILISSESAGLSTEDFARLSVLRRAEAGAEAEYLTARRELMNALSVRPIQDDGRAWLAASAKASVRQSSTRLKA
jgi:hypothetical protein